MTPRMAEANRHNAQKSTGPRTPEGKQRVAHHELQTGPGIEAVLEGVVAA